ncbi:ACP S-malonyltransferase [Undibacterium sp. Rencai35W]|uniref:ACP S-malonyltransferase n=1 Tax=Undibacterium sp. Rencai35W TaxID=3413046 RepID=UPI003BF11A6A
MTPRLLVLCSGQGNQHAGMFDLLSSTNSAEVLRDLCAPELDAIAEKPERIFANQYAQPLIVTSQMAIWNLLKDRIPAPNLVAGYSIGELSAYGIAGMLDARQIVGLARQRAQLMDACRNPQHAQIMVAVNGVQLRQVRNLIQDRGFEIAIINADDALILGGIADQFTKLETELVAQGAKVQQLPVHIASHTSCLRNACQPFHEKLQVCDFNIGTCPVISGKDGSQIYGKHAAVTQLSHQLLETIHWHDCMDAFAENGISVALELGPGAALSRMLQARHPQIVCRSVSEFRSVDGIIQWLSRHIE